MKSDHRHALSLAFDRGIVGEPNDDTWSFVNASPLPDLEPQWKQVLLCEQDFRSDHLALKKAGYRTSDEVLSVNDFQGAIFLLGRSRKWNEHKIARIWNRLPIGGRLIVVGAKNSGIASIRKWFAGHHTLEDSFSKFHSIVFWADKTAASKLPEFDIARKWNGYHLQEGSFSAEGADPASQLLVEYFDDRIKGTIADLGAGWGYLSAELLKRSSRVEHIDLFEADRQSLELATQNVKAIDALAETKITGNWIDVPSEFPRKSYHWVIMNPPFHIGRQTVPELGNRFIEVAASTLPAGGRLLMVANRNLPYEHTLNTSFRKVELLAARDGFKVYEASK